MAHGAVLRKPDSHVVGIRRTGVVLRMARITGRRSASEVVVEVACRAVELGVHSRQSKAGEFQVIELRSHPGIHGVATVARDWEPAGPVIQHGRCELLRVARIAIGAQAHKPASGGIHVAVLTLGGGMCSHQRKTILMVLDCLYPNLPALHRMTRFAIRSKLPAVKIGMAIRALRTHVGKHEAGVALSAGHVHVHPAQRVMRFVVVEFRDGPKRRPCSVGVAILARQIQRAVGTRHLGSRRGRRMLCRQTWRQESYENNHD